MADRGRRARHVFFIYDHNMLKKEEDDLKDAILYFSPEETSGDDQCALCGQLMGMSEFLGATLSKSSPKLFKFVNKKFALKRIGAYSIGLQCSTFTPDSLMINQLCDMYDTFVTYHGSIDSLKLRFKDIQGGFLQELANIWRTLLTVAMATHSNSLTLTFQSIPFVQLPKTGSDLFLQATHMLQSSQRRPYVLAGAIFYKNSVLSTQLPPNLTRQLLMLQNQMPHIAKKTDFELPVGCRVITIFLCDNDLHEISPVDPRARRHCKATDFSVRREKEGNISQSSQSRKNINLLRRQTCPDLNFLSKAQQGSSNSAKPNKQLINDLKQSYSGNHGSVGVEQFSWGKPVSKLSLSHVPIVECMSGEVTTDGEVESQENPSIKSVDETYKFVEGDKDVPGGEVKAIGEGSETDASEENDAMIKQNTTAQTSEKENAIDHSESDVESSNILSPESVPLDKQASDPVEIEIPKTVEEVKQAGAANESLQEVLLHKDQVKEKAKGASVEPKDDVEIWSNQTTDCEMNVEDKGKSVIHVSVNNGHLDGKKEKEPNKSDLEDDDEKKDTCEKQRDDSSENKLDADNVEVAENKGNTGCESKNIEESKGSGNALGSGTKNSETESADKGRQDNNSDDEVFHADSKSEKGVNHNSSQKIPTDMDITHQRTNFEQTGTSASDKLKPERTVSANSKENIDPNSPSRLVSFSEDTLVDDSELETEAEDLDPVTFQPCINCLELSSQGLGAFKDRSLVRCPQCQEKYLAQKIFGNHGKNQEILKFERKSGSYESGTETEGPYEERVVNKKVENIMQGNSGGGSSSFSSDVSTDSTLSSYWTQEMDGLNDLTLYVQCHSDMAMYLVLENPERYEDNVLQSLWKGSLSQLAELDYYIKECLEEDADDIYNLELYKFLRYDKVSHGLRGTLEENIIQSSSKKDEQMQAHLQQMMATLHAEFDQGECLSDITLRSQTLCCYGHQTQIDETYFVPEGTQRLASGLPVPRESTYNLDVVARQRLAKDKHTSLL